jgi:hypothetical protein
MRIALVSGVTRAMARGIAVITIDEDEGPEKADPFLANHGKSRCLNCHDDGEVNHSPVRDYHSLY